MADDNSTTTFKGIPGFPGYRVGDDGSVWVAWRTCRSGRRLTERWKQLKTPPNDKGYSRVNLVSVSGKSKTFRVHRLVLEAFVGPCPQGMECRHLNRIKTDNRLVNLAWGTYEENFQDNLDAEVYAKGEDHTQAKLTESLVRAIRKERSLGIPLKLLASKYGVSVPNICTIVKRQSWKHVD